MIKSSADVETCFITWIILYNNCVVVSFNLFLLDIMRSILGVNANLPESPN